MGYLSEAINLLRKHWKDVAIAYLAYMVLVLVAAWVADTIADAASTGDTIVAGIFVMLVAYVILGWLAESAIVWVYQRVENNANIARAAKAGWSALWATIIYMIYAGILAIIAVLSAAVPVIGAALACALGLYTVAVISRVSWAPYFAKSGQGFLETLRRLRKINPVKAVEGGAVGLAASLPTLTLMVAVAAHVAFGGGIAEAVGANWVLYVYGAFAFITGLANLVFIGLPALTFYVYAEQELKE